MSEISLWLDSYDDIYSDFDSRNYLKRRVSEDFIDELKAALEFKTEHTEGIALLLPADKRIKEIEEAIALNVKEQFQNRYEFLNQNAQETYRKGIMMILSGVLIMAIDSFITFKSYHSFLITILRIIMEPAGWFLIWNGLDFVTYDYRKTKKLVVFFNILSQLKIHFKDI